MKVTIEGAMQMVSEQALAEAPAVPSYRIAWLRAEYAKRQRRQERYGRLHVVAMGGVTALLALAIVFWKGTWLREDGLNQLGAVITTGTNAIGSGIPLAAVLCVATLMIVLLHDVLDASA